MKFALRLVVSATFTFIFIIILLLFNSLWFQQIYNKGVPVGLNFKYDKKHVVTNLHNGTSHAKFVYNTVLPNQFQNVSLLNKDSLPIKIVDGVRNTGPDPIHHNHAKRLVVCLVCCGAERVAEAQITLKSVVMFSSASLTLLVFTQPEHFSTFHAMHAQWPRSTARRVSLEVREVKYPHGVSDALWRGLFKQCASLRLFLSSLLPTTDALLYVDTDVVFVSPPEDVWRHLGRMNSTQLAAATPEHETRAMGWYNRFARHPYYGSLGLNSGVMLLNLTRMRSFGWSEYIAPLRQQYDKKIVWGDQDLLNILFHFHPELVYEVDCSYNYRPDHCMYGNVCRVAGARLIHGARGAFHSDKFPPFRDLHAALTKFQVGRDDLLRDFVQPLHNRFLAAAAAASKSTDNTPRCVDAARAWLAPALAYAKRV